MKRINEKTKQPFEHGLVREDGYIFYKYVTSRLKKSGHFIEIWLNPDAFKIQKAKTNKSAIVWNKKNSSKANNKTAKRRATKHCATPPWLTKDHLTEIYEMYKQATYLSKTTGVPHQVDHIVPLKGRTVSGLHVPWNLQILTKLENISKSNKFV